MRDQKPSDKCTIDLRAFRMHHESFYEKGQLMNDWRVMVPGEHLSNENLLPPKYDNYKHMPHTYERVNISSTVECPMLSDMKIGSLMRLPVQPENGFQHRREVPEVIIECILDEDTASFVYLRPRPDRCHGNTLYQAEKILMMRSTDLDFLPEYKHRAKKQSHVSDVSVFKLHRIVQRLMQKQYSPGCYQVEFGARHVYNPYSTVALCFDYTISPICNELTVRDFTIQFKRQRLDRLYPAPNEELSCKVFGDFKPQNTRVCCQRVDLGKQCPDNVAFCSTHAPLVGFCHNALNQILLQKGSLKNFFSHLKAQNVEKLVVSGYQNIAENLIGSIFSNEEMRKELRLHSSGWLGDYTKCEEDNVVRFEYTYDKRNAPYYNIVRREVLHDHKERIVTLDILRQLGTVERTYSYLDFCKVFFPDRKLRKSEKFWLRGHHTAVIKVKDDWCENPNLTNEGQGISNLNYDLLCTIMEHLFNDKCVFLQHDPLFYHHGSPVGVRGDTAWEDESSFWSMMDKGVELNNIRDACKEYRVYRTRARKTCKMFLSAIGELKLCPYMIDPNFNYDSKDFDCETPGCCTPREYLSDYLSDHSN